MMFQAFAIFTAARWPGLEEVFAAYAKTPPTLTITTGVLLAAATGRAGWQKGKRGRPVKVVAAAG